MQKRRLIRTFENSRLPIFSKAEIERREAENVDQYRYDITREDAKEVVMLAGRFPEIVNPAKWARVSADERFLLLGQYVGAISTTNLNLIIAPKVDEDKKGNRRLNSNGCVDLSVLVKSARVSNLPTEEFAEPGVMDRDMFFLHTLKFLGDLTGEVQHGLRCGYVATLDDLKSLRGTLNTDRIALSSAVSPELIPCKFEEFEENTLHNQVLRRAVVIIRTMLLSYAKDAGASPDMQDKRSLPLLRSCDNLLDLLVRVDDVALTWEMISSVQLSRLEERYYGIFHYAKLLIKCAAPVLYNNISQPIAPDFLAGFSQVWDAAILYERHIANYLRKKLIDGQVRKRSIRYRVLAQSQSRVLVKFPPGPEGAAFGCAEIRPDIIIWDDEKNRAHLIIDTKWKRYSGVMSVTTDDAYQVHAYATTYSVKPGDGPKSSRSSKLVKKPVVRTKTYYPPVCLLYPSLGESTKPEQGDFTGIGSEFLLARSPMDLDNLEFDPSMVLGKWWPIKSKIS